MTGKQATDLLKLASKLLKQRNRCGEWLVIDDEPAICARERGICSPGQHGGSAS